MREERDKQDIRKREERHKKEKKGRNNQRKCLKSLNKWDIIYIINS